MRYPRNNSGNLAADSGSAGFVRTPFWTLVRSEPYRLFFPLGFFAGLSGISHWVFFSFGKAPWDVPLHFFLQIVGYIGLTAAGFLGTVFQRLTQTPPMKSPTLLLFLLLALFLLSSPVLQNATITAGMISGFFLLLFLWILSRLRSGKRPPPPLLLALPGLLCAGAAPIIRFRYSALGTDLFAQGFVLFLISGTAPVVGRRILEMPADPPVKMKPRFLAIVTVALTGLSLSFFLQCFVSTPTAPLVLRAVTFVTVLLVAGLHKPPSARCPQRLFFWLSLWFVPLGLAAAAATPPPYRPSVLHTTFIGGYSLMILFVALRVITVHGGRKYLVDRPFAPAWIFGLLLLASMFFRVAAPWTGKNYIRFLGTAGVLWITAHIVFLASAGRFLLTKPLTESSVS